MAEPADESSARRKRVNLFIVLVLAVQVLVPLRYYAGLTGGDDERFSWRMFSTVRLQKCDMSVSETRAGQTEAQRVNLTPILQVAWISILQRFRPSVVEAFLRFRCEESGIAAVLYERQCVAPDGTPLPANRLELDCETDVIRTLEAP